MKTGALTPLYRPGARTGWDRLPAHGKRTWRAVALAICAALFVLGLTQLFETRCTAGAACACASSPATAATATPGTILRAKSCAPDASKELLAGAP